MKVILCSIFISLFCLTDTFGQERLIRVNELLLGTWEGVAPLTVQSSDSAGVLKNIAFRAEILVRFRLSFQPNGGKYDVQLIRTEKATFSKVTPASAVSTLKYILEYGDSYKLFIRNNQIETGRYIPWEKEDTLKLDLELKIKPGKAGDRMKYLEEDFKNFEIKSINANTMVISIPTRSDWDKKQQRYQKIGRKDVSFKRVISPTP